MLAQSCLLFAPLLLIYYIYIITWHLPILLPTVLQSKLPRNLKNMSFGKYISLGLVVTGLVASSLLIAKFCFKFSFNNKSKKLKGKKIIVIGGGLSGLVASIRLATHGCSVDLIEANSFVGGCCSGIMKDGYVRIFYNLIFKYVFINCCVFLKKNGIGHADLVIVFN